MQRRALYVVRINSAGFGPAASIATTYDDDRETRACRLINVNKIYTDPPTTTASWHYSKSILLHPIKNVDRFNVSGFFFAVMVLSGAILHCVLDLWSSSKTGRKQVWLY